MLLKRLLLFLIGLIFCQARKLPDYVKVCKRNDPNFSKCIEKTIRDIIPYLVKGIPEMRVPPIDPLSIQKLTLDPGSGYKVEMSDMMFYGGKDMEVVKVNCDVKKNTFDMKFSVPNFYVRSKYKSTGKALLVELQGNGDMTANFTNVDIEGKFGATAYIKKGKEHFKFVKQNVTINVGSIQTYFHDLFKGNEELTKNTNKVFNDNSDILFDEIKPVISTAMSKLMTQVLNDVHDLFSLDVLYPES